MKAKKYKFRWNDIDLNYHVTSTAYLELFIQVRLEMMKDAGYGYKEFAKAGIGPMVIHEHIYYLKEVRGDEEIYIDIQLNGISKEGRYASFVQHLYNSKGEICCYLDVTFAWLDTKIRKITIPPKDLYDGMMGLKHTKNFRIMDSKDLKNAQVPYGKILDIDQLD